MKVAVLVLAAVLPPVAIAQRPDCPPHDAPPAMTPPGPPPVFQPRINAPATWDEALKMPPPKSEVIPLDTLSPAERQRVEADRTRRAANDGLIDGEDGHVAVHRQLLASASDRPARPLPEGAVEVAGTPLATWRFGGYLREFSPNRLSRMFSRDDGTLLYFQEWNFAVEGGAVMTFEGAPIAIGPHRATQGGVRGRSGCVLATLAWDDGRRQYQLEMSGPLSLRDQRALLRSIAQSIVSRSP
jgi:hypothetical protein